MNHPTSASLFDDDEAYNRPITVVTALAHNQPVTKAQLNFRRLVTKIEAKREQLQRWQAYTTRYQQRLINELQPLHAKMRAGQRQMALLIDALLSERGRRLGRVQKAKLGEVLMTLLTGLLEAEHDAELEALFDKYSEVSHEDIRQSQLDMTQDMLQEVFGLDVGDDHGAVSAEELLRHAQRKLQEESPDARTAKRAKASTGKAEAAQAKREQAAREVSQSLREVYRKLVSALHPDREPDVDARQRKTLMMQRVNLAYEANDLLTLLGLQLEIEQIDAEHLSTVSAERLGHYNQILREQLADLEAELDHCMRPFRCNTDQWGSSLTPEFVDRQMNIDIAEMKALYRRLQHDLVAFRDPKVLLDSLKYYKLEQDDDELDDPEELLELMEMMRSLQTDAKPRGKERRR
jgi:uncharacterized protein (DUF2164 family)